MSKQNNLTEQIKAKAYWRYNEHITPENMNEYIVLLEDVLAIIEADEKKHEALMSHLQPENRPKLKFGNRVPYYSTFHHDSVKYFEELDKLKLGTSDVVCIKRRELEALNLAKWLDENHPEGEKWASYGAKFMDTMILFRQFLLGDASPSTSTMEGKK